MPANTWRLPDLRPSLCLPESTRSKQWPLYALLPILKRADEHLETLVDMARGIEGVEVAVSIRQPNEENVFRCSTRANGEVDVSRVCAAFGGGRSVSAPTVST